MNQGFNGWAGAPIAPPASKYASSILTANVAMATAGTYYDGPSILLGPGLWFVTSTITVRNLTGGGVNLDVKLWDGANLFASTGSVAITGSQDYSYTLSAIVPLNTPTTVKASATCSANTVRISSNLNEGGLPGMASQMNAFKL